MLGLLLQQTNQPHRVNVILLVKLNGAAFFVALQLTDPQLLRLLAQSGDVEQVSCRIRQQAKAIDKLDFDLLQLILVLRAGNAFVERQARIDVGDEVVRQQRRHP